MFLQRPNPTRLNQRLGRTIGTYRKKRIGEKWAGGGQISTVLCSIPSTRPALVTERVSSDSATPEDPGTSSPRQQSKRAPATPLSQSPPIAAPKPKPKTKPPAPEDKPFDEFVGQLLIPALVKEVQVYGGPAPELKLESGPMPVVGGDCWMVKGNLPGERRFWLCFTDADIKSTKTVAIAEGGGDPSLLESFLIDERKITLALLVSRLVQRLNGQKWLGPN